MAVAPANALVPSGHAPAAERAFGLVDRQCRADPACRAAFNPTADLQRAMGRMSGIQGAPSAEIFAEKLRSLMYQPAGARRVPFILRRAAEGDLAPFYAATRPQAAFRYADGMYLSVTCAEGLALMNYPAAAKESRRTRFGDYRLRRPRAACSHWLTRPVPADHLRPVRSDAPVLLVSGELDPVSPPSWAAEAAKHLPNSRHLVIPSGGHLLDGLSGVDSCFDPLVLRFLETGNTATLDTKCIANMAPPPFTTSASP